MKKGQHLTLDDRCAIVHGLNNRDSFKAIANTLGKDYTTISKEAKNISPFPRPDAPEGSITTASTAPSLLKASCVVNVPIIK